MAKETSFRGQAKQNSKKKIEIDRQNYSLRVYMEADAERDRKANQGQSTTGKLWSLWRQAEQDEEETVELPQKNDRSLPDADSERDRKANQGQSTTGKLRSLGRHAKQDEEETVELPQKNERSPPEVRNRESTWRPELLNVKLSFVFKILVLLLILAILGTIIWVAWYGFEWHTCRNRDCKCVAMPPGVPKIGMGVDIRKLDLFPMYGDTTEGFRKVVVDLYCNHKATWTKNDGTVYSQPDQVDLTYVSHWSATGSAKTIRTSAELREFISGSTSAKVSKTKTIGLEGKVPIYGSGLAIKAGYSSDNYFSEANSMKSAIEQFAENDIYLTIASAEKSTIQIDMKSSESSKLGADAMLNLKLLPGELTEDSYCQYKDFVRQFGTHYMSRATLGGRFMKRYETSKSFFEDNSTSENEKISESENMAKLDFSIGWGPVKFGTSLTKKEKEKIWNTESNSVKYSEFISNSNHHVITFGGKTTGDYSGWANSLWDEPRVISVQLNPITDLLPREMIHYIKNVGAVISNELVKSYLEECKSVLDALVESRDPSYNVGVLLISKMVVEDEISKLVPNQTMVETIKEYRQAQWSDEKLLNYFKTVDEYKHIFVCSSMLAGLRSGLNHRLLTSSYAKELADWTYQYPQYAFAVIQFYVGLPLDVSNSDDSFDDCRTTGCCTQGMMQSFEVEAKYEDGHGNIKPCSTRMVIMWRLKTHETDEKVRLGEVGSNNCGLSFRFPMAKYYKTNVIRDRPYFSDPTCNDPKRCSKDEVYLLLC